MNHLNLCVMYSGKTETKDILNFMGGKTRWRNDAPRMTKRVACGPPVVPSFKHAIRLRMTNRRNIMERNHRTRMDEREHVRGNKKHIRRTTEHFIRKTKVCPQAIKR